MQRPVALLLCALAVCALAACASAPRGTPVSMDSPAPSALDLSGRYEPEGEIYGAFGRTPGVSNSYGRFRIVGPRTSLVRSQDGSWAGTLAGRTVRLEARGGRITGAGVDLQVSRDGEELRVSGLWRNARLDLTFRDDAIRGTPGGGCSLSLRPGESTWWRGFLACPEQDMAAMRLEGAAGELPGVPMPQWLFAFLATLPEGP
jgi:hypothetical protein